MNEITLEMAKQVNAKELHFAKFQLMSDDKNNSITVAKGKKAVNIHYNSGSDLYELEFVKLKNWERLVVDEKKGVYGDQLQGFIQGFFPNFEYVMDSIRIVGLNC
jgi:hypothetical protein